VDYFKPFIDVYERFGWVGLIVALIYVDSFLLPKIIRAWKGDKYISWKDLHDRQNIYERKIEMIERSHVEIAKMVGILDGNYSRQVEKDALRDIQNAELRTDHVSLKLLLQTEREHIFSQLKSLHDKVDQNYKSIMEVLLRK